MTDMNDTTNTRTGSLPQLPIIESILWKAPSQTTPVDQATSNDRLKLYANADSHDWQEYVPDQVASDSSIPGVLVNYWDGQPPAAYTLTLRSYWQLIPSTYTQVSSGGGFEKEYTTTVGISNTESSTLSAELGVEVEGLSAKISASFTSSVTTTSETQETTKYTVGSPEKGYTRVWMLWQLVDELVALDPQGKIVSNPTRRGDVNWSQHNQSGAYLSYQNLHQHFPSTIIVPTQQDFLIPAKTTVPTQQNSPILTA